MSVLVRATGPSTLRTMTFPDADAIVMTDVGASAGKVLVGGAPPTWTASPSLTSLVLSSTLVCGFVTVQTNAGGSAVDLKGRNNAGTDEAYLSFYKFDGVTPHGYIIGKSGALVLTDALGQDTVFIKSLVVGIGGSTAAFPGLTRSGANLQVRLADNSALTVVEASAIVVGGYYEGTEMAAPAAGAANTGRIFFQDNGAGKTQLMVIFASGAAQQIAIQP